MLTPEYLDHVGDELLDLYSKLDESILQDITRRLVKAGKATATAQWQIWRAQESGLLYDDIIAEAAKLSGTSDQYVRAIFEDAGAVSVSYDNRIYEAAGLTPLPIKSSPSAAQVLYAGIEKTAGHLNNLTMTTASTAQQVFIQAATLAEMQVESGAFDYITAIRNAVREASKENKWISYPSGHRDRIDVAMHRAVLTGVSQTTGKISMVYAQDMGCDLMEITAHAGARPSHSLWQGQIVSLSGRAGYWSLEGIGYNTGAGFKGWNCRHDWYPFFEGLSESAYPRREIEAYNNATVRYDGRTIPLYDATQMQRAMEREIRDTKRLLAGLDAGIEETSDGALKAALKQDFTAKSALLKRQEAALKEFLWETGLLNDSSRVQVSGFGHSQASKAVWANRKKVASPSKKSYNRGIDRRQKMDQKTLFQKIDQTDSYTSEYKQKLKDAYIFFSKKGYFFREHALNRFLGQKSGKDKFQFSQEVLIDVLGKEYNYRQPDGKLVRFYHNIAVIAASDTGEIVSIVVRNRPKADWRDFDDKK